MDDIRPTASRTGDKYHDKADDVDIQAIESDSHMDGAGKFLAKMRARPDGASLVAPWTEAEERAVKRKADMIVMPLLFFSLSMGAVDKVALGTAAILGIRTDLGLVGQEYSWCSSLIFFGQLATVFPALFVMQKYATGKVVALNVMVWGLISCCIAACRNYAGLAVCRFMLGFFESLCFPGFSLILTSWYTSQEQVLRLAIMYNTFSSVTNGLISFGASFTPADSKLAPWQVLFICVGAITFVIGALMLVFLPNEPFSAWWLNDRQRCIAVMRIAQNRTGVQNKKFIASQAKEALLDIKTWIVLFINIGLNIPNGGTATFSSIIINGLGFTPRNTMLLQIPTGLFSWLSSLVFSYVAYKTKQRALTAAAVGIIPLIGTILLTVLPRSNVGGSLASLYIVYFYWAPYVITNSLVMANMAGQTKKTVSYGVAYCGYLIGNIIGPQTFLANQAPKYTGGIVAMMVGYVVAVVLLVLYYFNIVRLSRGKKNYLEQHPEDQTSSELLNEWHDETDFQNKRFVYTK